MQTKIKTRLVGCGYSQVEGRDFFDIYAHTLPGLCFRIFCSIVADEDLETDQIDAVKAFTQADIDRELYCEMPEGFAVEGYVLKLFKALEGIRQGAFLWFQLNKYAWEKCGCVASPHEPNLYTHPVIGAIVAVFADDCGIGFPKAMTQEYLAMRAEYAKISPLLQAEVEGGSASETEASGGPCVHAAHMLGWCYRHGDGVE